MYSFGSTPPATATTLAHDLQRRKRARNSAAAGHAELPSSSQDDFESVFSTRPLKIARSEDRLKKNKRLEELKEEVELSASQQRVVDAIDEGVCPL